MSTTSGLRATTAGLLAALLVAGCGRKDAQPEPSTEAASAEDTATQPEASSAAQPAQPAGNPTTAPLTKEDIARWEKGIAGEMQAVKEASAKMKSARSSEDTLNAMMGMQEMTTREAGANAAGVNAERYGFIRSNLSAVVAYLTPALAMDTTMLSAAQLEELRQGNQAQLERMRNEVPPEVVEALRPRAIELRKKDMELVGARLKGSGM